MLTAKPQLNLRHAREYFREHLCVGDYYSAGQSVTGEWFGLGAERLGLKGPVGEREFLRLCTGQHPESGERLTQRLNASRQSAEGRTVANRRVFYDFTLSPPKSVSVVGLYQDERIVALHSQAVKRAMEELERFAESRVRKGQQRTERVTGNILGASFRHDTSRELDPHLHTHCVVFNATFDPSEDRWKALEVQGMYRAQKFVENYYFHELAKGLRGLGYDIVNRGRAFDIKGVPESLVRRFSKRHEEIDREAEKRLRAQTWRGKVKDLREHVARSVRKRKAKDSNATRLRPHWDRQMTPSERADLRNLIGAQEPDGPSADVPAIVAWADEHLFERRSIVHEHELLATALARGRGERFDLAALRAAVNARQYIREEGSSRLTSGEVLRRELELVVAAHDGRERYAPFNPAPTRSKSLSSEQAAAVTQLLASRDLVTLFRGGAGTGKSFTLKELHRGITTTRRAVVILAPQRQQVADLSADGLAADTLARFLQAGTLARGAVVVVDEAGQVGGRDLRKLLQIVEAAHGRLILSGDTHQHGAVAASDALRAIEAHAGLTPAVLKEIRRQDPTRGKTADERRFIRRYRGAVKAAAMGKTGASFDALDRLHCIREVSAAERRTALAEEYVSATARKEKPLVVAQTREEVMKSNEAIRDRLKEAGAIGSGPVLTACRPIDLSEAQKRDARFYAPGQRAFFLQRYGRFAKGALCEIVAATPRGLTLMQDGRRSTVSYRYAHRLVVADSVDLEISGGDRLQLKFNGKSEDGKALSNGELVTVDRVRTDGAIVVHSDGGTRKTLSPSQRLFVRGFAVTSYGSQGKTVDTVILSDAGNAAATSANQWYVSISRGRQRVVVFTSNKEALRAHVQSLDKRALALDLRPPADLRWDTPELRRRMLATIRHQQRHASVVQRHSPPRRDSRLTP